jgi:hypothetical protein
MLEQLGLQHLVLLFLKTYFKLLLWFGVVEEEVVILMVPMELVVAVAVLFMAY